MKRRLISIAGLCACTALISCCAMLSSIPQANAATNTGTTDFKIQADDSQISWTVPVAVSFAVKGDGSFVVPTNGQFQNNSVFAIHISSIKATAGSGVSLAKTTAITSATAADTVGVTITPGSGTAIEIADYTTAKAPTTASDWNIAKGSTLATAYTGKLSSYGSLSPASSVKAVTITWTAAAGTAS